MTVEHDDAVDLIGPDRLGQLKACVLGAWEDWESHFQAILPMPSAVGLANILREAVVQRVRAAFGDQAGVDIRDNVLGGRFLLILDSALVVQFRKLTKNFRTVNNPTAASDAFDRQESVEGFPALPRLTVGYQLSNYRTELAGVYLAFLIGKECVWYHDLATGESTLSIEFPDIEESAAEQEAKEAEERRKTEAGHEDETGTEGV